MDPASQAEQNLLPGGILPPPSVPSQFVGGAVPTAPGTQPVIVIMQAPDTGISKEDRKEHYRKTFPEKAVFGLSIFSIVAGLLSIILQVVLFCVGDYFEHIGQGVWCGIFFLLSGSFGAYAAKHPSPCSVINLMVFTILAACMCVPYIVLDGIGIGSHNYRRRWSLGGTGMAIYSIMLILGVTTGIASIVLSALTCRTTCCKAVKSTGAVMYNPATAQAIPLGNISQVINSQVPLYQTQPQQQQSPPPVYSAYGAQLQNQTERQNRDNDDLEAGKTAYGSEYKRFE